MTFDFDATKSGWRKFRRNLVNDLRGFFWQWNPHFVGLKKLATGPHDSDYLPRATPRETCPKCQAEKKLIAIYGFDPDGFW